MQMPGHNGGSEEGERVGRVPFLASMPVAYGGDPPELGWLVPDAHPRQTGASGGQEFGKSR